MTETADIACSELVELVTDYLEDALPEDRRRAVDAHLAACPGCRAYLEQLRQTLRATGSLDAEALSPGRRQALLDLFGSLRRA